ncbi:hypothetical protein NEFER03_1939 [Nematocida sp. LUAm3]|nr:hypothetical protein NEFER03_1939 [Nematocida sp. LUAm3]KAI5176159.1 hypothetical protein NEFER02_1973 [Nematocida sp. LUAm2]KAI5179453.1 hypothetical protein NEFER01_2262 [Nematocida sp. LUAm1]
MEIGLRKEKKGTHAVECVWKRFVAFMVLLGVVLSMGNYLRKPKDSTEDNIKCSAEHNVVSTDKANPSIIEEGAIEENPKDVMQEVNEIENEKKEIAKVLLEYLSIKKEENTNTSSSCGALDSLYKRMEYKKEDDQYYIDLVDFSITKSSLELTFHNYGRFEKALERIEGIRCENVYINSYIPLRLIEILIRRMVIKHDLNINCSHLGIMKLQESDKDNNTEYEMPNILSKTGWDEPTSFQIFFISCSNNTIQTILNCFCPRAIKKIIVSKSSIHVLDLKEAATIHGYYIVLLGLAFINRIPFLEVEGKPSIKLKARPTSTSSDSNAVENSLHLDRTTLKSLANAYKTTQNRDKRKVLQVKNLHLEYAPYTFQEIAGISGSSWIRIESLTIHADICDVCGIYKKELIVEKDLLGMVKKMKIRHLTGTPTYEIVNSILGRWNNTSIIAHHFLKLISHDAKLKMINTYYSSAHRHPIYFIRSFTIYLKDSTRIQEAIDMFQQNCDMMSAYTVFQTITIYESGNTFNDLKLLARIIKCMGPRIKIDSISFHNIKEYVSLGPQKEIPSFIRMLRTTFIMKNLYFIQSTKSFINGVLINYNYSPVPKIYINDEIYTKGIKNIE